MLADPSITADELAALDAARLGELGAKLLLRIEHDRKEIDWRDARLEKLSFEMAQLKRKKFGKKSKQLDAEQRALFDEAIDADSRSLGTTFEEHAGFDSNHFMARGGCPCLRFLAPRQRINLQLIGRHHEFRTV